MTIFNNREKQLSIALIRFGDKENTVCLAGAIIAAIKWNSFCKASTKYDIDGENVCTLLQLLEQFIYKPIFKNDALILNIPTIKPEEEKGKIIRAIVASFRWKAICDDHYRDQADNQHMEFLAMFIEGMFEDNETIKD